MINNSQHEKIALSLSFLILNNYFFLSLGFPQILIKINFLIFIFIILLFYFQNLLNNPYLKISFFFIILISLGTPVIEWDARSIWLFHAKRIFYESSILKIAEGYEYSNNGYPNLAPAFASALAILIGYWNEVFPKIAFTLIFLPPMILIHSFLKNVNYLIFLTIVFFTIGKYLFNGYADGLVAMYFGSSALLIYLLFFTKENFYRNRLYFYVITFCFFTTLTLIKNEGSALLLVLLFTVFLINLYNGNLKNNLLKLSFFSFSFLPIILWKIYCYTKGMNYYYTNDSIILNLAPRLTDLNSYKEIIYFLILNEKFLITLVFFLLSIFLSPNKSLFIFVSHITLIYIFILFIIYLSTPFDLHWHLDSSASRVIKSLCFFLGLFGIYNLSLRTNE